MAGMVDAPELVPMEHRGVEAVPISEGGEQGQARRMVLRPMTDRYPVDVGRFTLVMKDPEPGKPMPVRERLQQQRYVLYEGNRKALVIWALNPQEALEEAVDYMLVPRVGSLMKDILATHAVRDAAGEGLAPMEVKSMLVSQLGLTKRQARLAKGQVRGLSLFEMNFASANTALRKQGLITYLNSKRKKSVITEKGREAFVKDESLKRTGRSLPNKLVDVPVPDAKDRKLLLRSLVKVLGSYCQGCGDGPYDNLRHLALVFKLPRLDGGNDNPDNLAPLCRPCGDRKGDTLTLTGLRRRNLDQGLMVDGQVLLNWRLKR